MHITVIGAAGKSGAAVVQQALVAGHTVTAFVHHSEGYTPAAGVTVVEGDSTDLTAISGAITGSAAIVDCIGGATPYKHTKLERNTAGTVIQAIREQTHGGQSPARLIAISMIGIDDSMQQTPFWYEYLMMPTFLHGATPDKTAMEAAIKKSGIPFILVRPPLLTDGDATGTIKVLGPTETGHKITRADLAHFIVQQLNSDTYLNQAVTVVNS